MELGVSAARPRLSELIAAGRRGERVVITKRGVPAAELVACRIASADVQPLPSRGEGEGAPVAHGESLAGEPAVPAPRKKRPHGDFFARLEAVRKRLGITAMPPEEGRAFSEALHDSALSRRVLGANDD